MVVPIKYQKKSWEDQLLGSLWKFLKDIWQFYKLSLLLSHFLL